MVPNRAKNTSAIEKLAPLKRRMRNSRMSSIGEAVRSSQITNAASTSRGRREAAEDEPAGPAALAAPR